MTLIEDHQLDAVSGAYTQQEIFDFVERVLRESSRLLDQPNDPSGY